jgi:hypothetical protein
MWQPSEKSRGKESHERRKAHGRKFFESREGCAREDETLTLNALSCSTELTTNQRSRCPRKGALVAIGKKKYTSVQEMPAAACK